MKRIAWIGISLTMPILAWAQTPGLELYKQGKHAEAASALAAEVEQIAGKQGAPYSPRSRADPRGRSGKRSRAPEESDRARRQLRRSALRPRARVRKDEEHEPGDSRAREGDEMRAESRLRPLLSGHGLQPDRQEGSLDRALEAFPRARSRRTGGSGGEVVPFEDVSRPVGKSDSTNRFKQNVLL